MTGPFFRRLSALVQVREVEARISGGAANTGASASQPGQSPSRGYYDGRSGGGSSGSSGSGGSSSGKYGGHLSASPREVAHMGSVGAVSELPGQGVVMPVSVAVTQGLRYYLVCW